MILAYIYLIVAMLFIAGAYKSKEQFSTLEALMIGIMWPLVGYCLLCLWVAEMWGDE